MGWQQTINEGLGKRGDWGREWGGAGREGVEWWDEGNR